MRYDVLIFDMDGTLCDSRPGIFNGLNHALKQAGFPLLAWEDILPYIGPPLQVSIQKLTGYTNPEQLESVIQLYRDYYAEQGIHELSLYDGIPEALQQLQGQIPLGVCTSKRQDFASQIIENLQLGQYFDFVSGSRPGQAKWQQLDELLQQQTITRQSIMIGDRLHDIEAAKKNNLPSLGVLWGYGDEPELRRAGADQVITHPSAIQGLL